MQFISHQDKISDISVGVFKRNTEAELDLYFGHTHQKCGTITATPQGQK